MQSLTVSMATSMEDPIEKREKEESGAPHFSSKLGLICSCLGCVVGTGNIWRFPRIVANNSENEGGLVFLIVWMIFLFLWSSPMLIIEYGTGRYTKKAIIGSFRELLGDKAAWCGAWISMVTFLISCYYSVVLGWCFYYVFYCIANELPDDDVVSTEIFNDFAKESYWPILTHALALLTAGFAVIKGVKTFEKVNMVLVPVLLLIIMFTFVWSLTREYADYGIKFLFTPDWESLGKPRLWVDAISQNAFDTGAGMGLMIPYSSFMTRDHAIVKYATLIPATNNVVSLVCGMLIFSTVFSTLITSRPSIGRNDIVTILKTSGPASTGLTFIWIPVLFSTLGTFGRVLAILFFFCLSCAGVTSLISNMELVCHTLEDFGLPRKFGMPGTVLLLFGVGVMSAVDINILTNQDFVWAFALLINGLMLQFLVVKYGLNKFRLDMFNNYGTDDWKLPSFWKWIVLIIAPIEAFVILVWWVVDLIQDEDDADDKWYEFGTETFMVTIVQWISLALFVILINMMWLYCKRLYGKSDETIRLLGHNRKSSAGELDFHRSVGVPAQEITVKDVKL
ncbi:uncharacterized protein LOC110465744 [Mizuhopecten yessoensis]|uniref:Sodium-and chloride-dependent GABA transporter ine n=1 Tax=Mizuhopecten yessoensis TaxID=6573 RepID=A0A210PQP9_MIZYE|nr:uncharacterized protein LOC110465744 [Mizuhopecten yessoensis]OWF38829.1 Sodium- and chloride-dependent GABA transporter ine [Mizuhopecten yessoensis]